MTALSFKGKEFVYNHHLAVPFRPLVPHPDKGIGPASLDGNLIVQGDNLHALKALLPYYAGKVDCIFIDPPYNTGNEGWSYNDNVNAPITREWLNNNPIGIEDGLRHDKWCAMMWPRLRLLHELLSESGLIFTTLDGNEQYRFHSLMDEVFGDTNYVATIAWQKRTSPDARKNLSAAHDNVIVYAKNLEEGKLSLNKMPLSAGRIEAHRNLDDDPRGEWASVDITGQVGHATDDQFYEITLPSGRIISPPDGRCWALAKQTFESLVQDNRIWFGMDGDSRPRLKKFLSESEGTTVWTWWPYQECGTNENASQLLRNIMGEPVVFDNPKPIELLNRIIDLSTDKNAVILDSFAGSGTTAHAALKANKHDGGNRQFILVEMEDYADRLTAERVRRVINGYDFHGTQKTELLRERLTFSKLNSPEQLLHQIEGIENLQAHEFDRIKKEVKDGELIVTGEKKVESRAEGLGGTFTYCTLGEPIELDKILTGTDLPAYDSLGAVLFNMATSKVLDLAAVRESDFYLGDTGSQQVWLIYKPDLEWLKSPDAALTLSRAQAFAASDPEKRHLVFAPARYVSQKMLDEQNLPVEFVPLPFALYRIDRS